MTAAKRQEFAPTTLAELRQMLSAPYDAYSDAEWCAAANNLLIGIDYLESKLGKSMWDIEGMFDRGLATKETWG